MSFNDIDDEPNESYDWEDDDRENLDQEQPDEQEMVGPRITYGQESQYSSSFGNFFSATTSDDPELAKKLRKVNRMTRTPQQKFEESLFKIYMSLPDQYKSVAEAVAKQSGDIPDVRFKSPAASVYGYMIRNIVNIRMTDRDEELFNKVKELADEMVGKISRPSDLAIYRYGRMWAEIKNNS